MCRSTTERSSTFESPLRRRVRLFGPAGVPSTFVAIRSKTFSHRSMSMFPTGTEFRSSHRRASWWLRVMWTLPSFSGRPCGPR